MKKSYHSSEVPTRLATMTRRTDEPWTVPLVGGIGISLGHYSRSGLFQHSPDHVGAQQQGIHGILTQRNDPGLARATRRLLTTSSRPPVGRWRAVGPTS